MAQELERLALAGEEEAAERSWQVVRAAFAARTPTPAVRRPSLRAAAVAVAAVAVVAAAAAAATSAGRGVVDELRRAVGIESASPVLSSLPTGGSVLVSGRGGSWIVGPDGSRRRLGGYPEASWSPFGRFVIAVEADRRQLTALEPDGDVRWTIARPGPIRLPRWGGTADDTRIAYLSRGALRVVAGDGRPDRQLAARVLPVAPAWRPGPRHVLAFVDGGGAVVMVDSDTGAVRARAEPLHEVRELQWSGDGRLLLVRAARGLAVLDGQGRRRYALLGREAAPVADATFVGRGVAFVQWADGGSSVWHVPRLAADRSAARRVFEGAGRIDGVHPSPDGRWLLLSWPSADQWVFVRTAGAPRIDGVDGIWRQLRSSATVEGWCCAG
jgi:hypothetical protein